MRKLCVFSRNLRVLISIQKTSSQFEAMINSSMAFMASSFWGFETGKKSRESVDGKFHFIQLITHVSESSKYDGFRRCNKKFLVKSPNKQQHKTNRFGAGGRPNFDRKSRSAVKNVKFLMWFSFASDSDKCSIINQFLWDVHLHVTSINDRQMWASRCSFIISVEEISESTKYYTSKVNNVNSTELWKIQLNWILANAKVNWKIKFNRKKTLLVLLLWWDIFGIIMIIIIQSWSVKVPVKIR